MTLRRLLFATLLALLGSMASCDSPSMDPAGVCDHDGCVVSLTEAEPICGANLKAASTDCPGTKVESGTCGGVTHLEITTVNPIHDCYYTTSSGQLVGAVVRSDAGFTKMAGTIPTEACPATTPTCDHTPPM